MAYSQGGSAEGKTSSEVEELSIIARYLDSTLIKLMQQKPRITLCKIKSRKAVKENIFFEVGQEQTSRQK